MTLGDKVNWFNQNAPIFIDAVYTEDLGVSITAIDSLGVYYAELGSLVDLDYSILQELSEQDVLQLIKSVTELCRFESLEENEIDRLWELTNDCR